MVQAQKTMRLFSFPKNPFPKNPCLRAPCFWREESVVHFIGIADSTPPRLQPAATAYPDTFAPTAPAPLPEDSASPAPAPAPISP
jgi:hypothetical protein